MNPIYLYGSTITQMFTPLYFFGCPKTFLNELSSFFSPSVGPKIGSKNFSELLLEDIMSPFDNTFVDNGKTFSLIAFLISWVGLQLLILELQNRKGKNTNFLLLI